MADDRARGGLPLLEGQSLSGSAPRGSSSGARRGFRRAPRLRVMLGGLALGALAMPLALVLVLSVLMSRSLAETPLLRFLYVSQELLKAVRPDGAGGLAPIPGYLPPPRFHIVIAGMDGKIVLSTMPSMEAGGLSNLGAAAALARASSDPGKGTSFFAEAVEIEGEILGSYFAWMPPDDLRNSVDMRVRIGQLASLGALAGIAFLLGVVVAARLARGMLRLERAAGRIAAGDLESLVQVEGVREIVVLAEAMDGMRRSLRENRDRRARFLAAVSHDLRTPLTSIGGYLEAVEDGLASDPATLSRYVAIMREKTRLLEGRIAGLLEFARMETGEWRMSFEMVELGPFLELASRDYAQDAALLGRSFVRDLAAADGARVAADRALLARALENLVSNAMHYSPPGSTVGLYARRVCAGAGADGRDTLVLDLDDAGSGIPLAERSMIFEPFYRGSGARQGEGSGLGLYIALSVIRGHGWTLSAGESPGGGGRFTLEIPLATREAG